MKQQELGQKISLTMFFIQKVPTKTIFIMDYIFPCVMKLIFV